MGTDPKADPREESFAAMFEEASRAAPSKRRPQPGDTVDAVVVQVGKEAVFVEIDGTHQGFIDSTELWDATGAVSVAVGGKLRARVVRTDADGVRLTPTVESAAAAGASVSVTGSTEADAVKVALGQKVSGEVSRVESYGVFVQIDGTKGRAGRGLIPTVELGVPRGTDLRKAFPPGAKLSAKVLEITEGKMRLSVRALKDDEERAHFEGFRDQGKATTPQGFGTFGDLLKGRGSRG
jgi:small subunit ribosomal protein S1